MAGGFLNVEVPKMPKTPGGLLDVLEHNGLVVHESDSRIGAGITYDMPFSQPAYPAPGLCDAAPEMSGFDEKQFFPPESGESDPFAIHYGVQCLPGQYDYEQMARDGLDNGQSYALMIGLQEIILSGATVLTGGPWAVKHVVAWADSKFGPAFISTSRYGASYLGGYRGVKDIDFRLYTRQGTPIINDGIIHPAAVGSTFDVYVHSPVALYLGPVITGRGFDLTHNVETAVAERVAVFTKPAWVYRMTVDPAL